MSQVQILSSRLNESIDNLTIVDAFSFSQDLIAYNAIESVFGRKAFRKFISSKITQYSEKKSYLCQAYQWGRPGFDSMMNWYVSMSGAVKRPVNPGHKILIGENNYALAA